MIFSDPGVRGQAMGVRGEWSQSSNGCDSAVKGTETVSGVSEEPFC